MKSQFFTKTLLLATAFACGGFASTTTYDHDEYHRSAQAACGQVANEIGNKKYESWWGAYQKSGKEIYVYIHAISDIDPEQATWFYGGGKYGFTTDKVANDEQSKLLISAMEKTAHAFAKQRAAGAPPPPRSRSG